MPDEIPSPGIKRGMSIWTWAMNFGKESLVPGQFYPKKPTRPSGQAEILQHLDPSKIGWWYDWRTTVVPGQWWGGHLTGQGKKGKIPFVPMIYSEDWLGDYTG